ncbi:MAG TPA: YegS/Rv2252/BmrU family lipid kinase [Blastocatellia bacterium]|nr:YegS/Rv2252/BmrU family lipid kinase [Blastocatellia bacterium]
MIRRRATIIYNPMSGRAARRAENVQKMSRLLEERGLEVDARPTAGPDDATRLAREATAAGADIIISYGGDGTLNEVLQGMAGSQASLAVWPGGTANVVATDLGVSSDIAKLAEMIAAGKTRRIALGLAKSEGETGRVGDGATLAPSPRHPLARSRYFIMMAGIGLDASVARKVNLKLKRRTGEFAYWVEGIKHLFTWQAEPFTIDADGRRYESAFTLIGNGKGYGGGLVLTPDAKLEEPWFEVFILPPLANNFAYLRAVGACIRGKPQTCGASLVKAKHVKANSAHEPWVEADGELIGPLPMTFDIVSDALSLIVP